MIEKLGEILKFRAKTIVIGMFALGVGLVCYKFMSAYFDRNETMWSTKLNADVAETLILADAKVTEARMEVKSSCGGYTIDGREDKDCPDSRKRLVLAELHLADVESKRDITLGQAGGTKKYYDGIVASSKQKPLPLYAFAGMGLMILASILYFLLPTLQRAIGKREDSNADGLV